MRCSNCGLNNPSGMLYCAQCGSPLSKENENNAHLPSQGVDGKDERARKGTGTTRKHILVPVAALVWLLVVVLVMGKEVFFSMRGYTSEANAIGALQEPLQTVFDSNFKDAELKKYTEAVLDSVPGEGKSAGINVSTMLLKSCDDETKQLVEYASNDGDSDLYVDIDADEGGDLDSESLAEVRSEMQKVGIDKNLEEGCRIKLGITISAYEDTPLLKEGRKKFEDIEDIGVCAVRAGNRWYLWPSQGA